MKRFNISEKHGLIFDTKRYAIHDGPGIRTTIFFKGCPLNCWWCHNPEGIEYHEELMYFEYQCMHCGTCYEVCLENAIEFDESPKIKRKLCTLCGDCSSSCPTTALRMVGETRTVDEVISEIEKDILFFDNSEGGVTFSGGEPLYQNTFLLKLLKECKKKGIHTTLDTSGFASKKVFASVIEHVDLFLYDLKLIDENEHIRYTGVSNRVILDNLRYLANKRKAEDIIIRFPVIPNITDTNRNVEGILDFISSLKGIKEIDLMPFHDVSEKYYRLDKKYKMDNQESPTKKRLLEIKEKFEKKGYIVKMN
ncbi:pyruvate formate-lyase [Petrotoga sp. 9PW.55.5.1]|uniref:glycyl-radical enzyme activating protein n=1 Tax=Petrotoga sp. 9PW.55.5.1 TaxID=1308979 RepID=UPI000DC54560|nr:glycyl-radical enzyme activating protein [Petrotoga sp. 9PW.55.5.1]RAO99853.1 pyruvate formate-lyase [Petrotoga sp. 9PW.55.5.1]